MPSPALRYLMGVVALLPAFSRAGCIPSSDAPKHIGETRCIVGKVVAVDKGSDGVHYLHFCEQAKGCPFTAVIFPEDLKQVGDVRQLEGKSIEVHGNLTEYDGEAQIIVSEPRQIKGTEAKLPPLPKAYDVEQRGHYSAGIFSHPKPARAPTKKRQTPTLPATIPDDPED